MEFCQQKDQSGLPFPSPGDLPDPGIKPGSPRLQADSSPSEPFGHSCLWKPSNCSRGYRLDSGIVVLAFPSHCIFCSGSNQIPIGPAYFSQKL